MYQNKAVLLQRLITGSMAIKYDEPVNMEWIAEMMHCSVRTATRRMQPLRIHLGLKPRQSFTKGQVLDFLT